MVSNSAREAVFSPAPSAFSVTAGLDLSGLADLTHGQRATIAVLMARASERAYRRGVQQGATFASEPGRLHPDLHNWRYGAGTDASPWADSNCVEMSLERLHTEEDDLARLGFPAVVQGVGTYDLDGAVERLRSLVQAFDRAGGESKPVREQAMASAAIRAFGIELATVGGYVALSDVYDELVERHGAMAARGVSPAWTGIGEWSA